MQEPQLVGAYGGKGAAADGGGASSDEVKELRALVEQQSRQIRTLARLTGSLGPVELAGEPHHEVNDVDPKKFGNTESLKHGLTKFYIEKPFWFNLTSTILPIIAVVGLAVSTCT